MNDISSLIALVGAGAALLGAVAAFLASKAILGRRLGDLTARLEKADRDRLQANELLQQAKRQIEVLNKDVEEARRASRKAAKAVAQGEATQPRDEEKARALAETRARLDQMLDAPASILGQGGFVNSGMARGFADTQPFSGFGPTQPRAA
jgi:F0F1-type ATP synthase membrane subunit b/b'